jgi:2',3'-cyclic-nucleotide 2'-phosphodiesterase / 3'-nucleotidase
VAPSAALDLIARAKADHVRGALADSAWAGLPILSSASPFRGGGRGGPQNFTDIPAGPLRMRHLSDLYPFPNTIVTLLMTGSEIADWLERSAAVFRQVAPGTVDAPLMDADVPSFVFETIPQLSYAIDLSQPARFDGQGRLVQPDARRITGLRYDGKPVLACDEFLMVTNNHRAGRARLHDPMADPQIVYTDGARVQSILAALIQREGSIGTAPERNWHFLPMPGTSVSLATGDGAPPHLEDIAGYRPQVLGRDGAGFTHYRLHL